MVFHIGTHKTGTTSIQDTFDLNIELLKQNRVRYFTLHKELKFLHKAFFPEAYNVVRSEELSRDAIDKFCNIINSSDFDTYIISGEDMSGSIWNWSERLTLLAEVAKRFPDDEIDVLVYFRNPVSSCISIYQELVKGNKFLHSFESFLSDERFSIFTGGLDWYKRALQIQDIVKPNKLTVSCFETAATKGLISDFVDSVGISPDIEILEAKSSNQSINMTQLMEMLECNKDYDGTELVSKKANILLSDVSGKSVSNLLSDSSKKQLTQIYLESNQKLFDEYIEEPLNSHWK
jgi:hypothetical protein